MFQPPPDAVLLSGDLADHATDEEYEHLHELLAPLQAPVTCCRATTTTGAPFIATRRPRRRRGAGRYSVDLGPLRLVVLDTTRPGEASGALKGDQLDWLDAELAAAPEQPTLPAMHHPPLVIGVPSWDEIGLGSADRHASAM